MPIRPEQRALYPKDWEAISLRIRTERAGGRCEFCREALNGQPHPVTGSKVVLTTAHLNHNPADCRDENLAAMCQKCHLTYDAALHRENAARTRRGRRAQLDLVDRLDVGIRSSALVGHVSDASTLEELKQCDCLEQVYVAGHQTPEMRADNTVVVHAHLNDRPSGAVPDNFVPEPHDGFTPKHNGNTSVEPGDTQSQLPSRGVSPLPDNIGTSPAEAGRCACPPLPHLVGDGRAGYRCARCGRPPAPVRQNDDTERDEREPA